MVLENPYCLLLRKKLLEADVCGATLSVYGQAKKYAQPELESNLRSSEC